MCIGRREFAVWSSLSFAFCLCVVKKGVRYPHFYYLLLHSSFVYVKKGVNMGEANFVSFFSMFECVLPLLFITFLLCIVKKVLTSVKQRTRIAKMNCTVGVLTFFHSKK